MRRRVVLSLWQEIEDGVVMRRSVGDDLRIRSMSPDEVVYAIDLAAAEGWNPGVLDNVTFPLADPEGFLVATLDETPVGCISALAYGSSFGFLGLYIVEAAMRGQGIGRALWDVAVARLGGRVVGLDGVVAMQHAYAASGFVLAHRNVRYAGDVSRDRRSLPEVVPATESDLDEVLAYDESCFLAPRREFMVAWLCQPRGIARVLRRGGRLVGFAVARQCRDGVKVGPLFADDVHVAQALFDSVVNEIPEGQAVILDVPEPNSAARAIAEEAGMTPVFETARMYAGGGHALPVERIFGITTFELG
jgi:GNAT superfamily N-acetyltransferase